jgi:hypothetical protein
MNIDLNKTMGYDVGRRNGKATCHQTLTSQTDALGSAIVKDVAQLINEAGFSGATVKEQLPIARLMGYVEALATAVSLAEACGITFTTTLKQDGTEGLAARIDYQAPLSINPITGQRN